MPRRAEKQGEEMTGFVPVATEALETDIRTEKSVPKSKEFHIQSSWVPMTPMKPICTERRENQFVAERDPTGFEQGPVAETIADYCESLKSIDIENGFDNWEAALEARIQSRGGVRKCSEFSMEPNRFKNRPFANLSTLADAASTSANSAYATQRGNENAASSSMAPILDPKLEGNQLEASSTTSSVANQDTSLGSNLWINRSCAPDTHLGRNSTPSQPPCDLSSLPGALTDTFSSRNSPSQFAPITPDKPKKSGNKEAHGILISNMYERANQERDKQGNDVGTSKFEVEELHHDKHQLPKDMSSAVVSTELHENHNHDKEGNLEIDLNGTPQQKPRRKKHRPKVVREGQQPKRTRNPVTPKPVGPVEKPTGKRKYVRKIKLDKTPGNPTAEVTSGTTDPEPEPRAAKSCRRTLNFDNESQVREEFSSSRLQSNTNAESQSQNFYTGVESKSNEQLGQGEAMVEKTQVGIAYELTHSMNKVVEEYISVPERRAECPQTPTRTDLLNENLKASDQNEPIKGKCKIVFSDRTHDEQGSIIQGMTKTDTQSAPRTPNNSNRSSSTCLTEGEQARGLMKGNSCMSHEAEPSSTNVTGARYNSMDAYWAMFPAVIYNDGFPGIQFPTNSNGKRSQKGHSSTTSSALATVTAANNGLIQGTPWSMNNGFAACRLISSSISPNTASATGAQGKQQSFDYKLALNLKGRISKKREKGPTPMGNFASLIGSVECRQGPTFPAEGSPEWGIMQGYQVLPHPHTCPDALVADTHATMKKKKQTKRNPFAGSVGTDPTQRRIPSINEITEQFKSLDITNQEQRALVPYFIRYEDQNALVLYQRDGTVVPFEGSFNPVRKRRPRPRVDLDEETNRVWKLLLENINSEGIDGTDEEKSKWWEEERRVFRGRADSFIARMHLVQGDRRFSPWKGSVLDSVIGVFLTQNVSDHLSSSAFMSLAARFPLKSKCSQTNDTNQPACDRSSVSFRDTDYCSEKEVVYDIESLGSSSGGEKSVNNLESKTTDISGNGLEMYYESTANRTVIQVKQAVSSSTGDDREMDDVLSSQYSGGSSQNSVESSMAQTAERTGSFLQDNSETADPATRSNLNSLVGSSFMELLRRQEERLYSHKSGNAPCYEENGYSCIEGTEFDKQDQNKHESDNSTLRSVIPSSNYNLLETANTRVLQDDSFKMLGEQRPLSDISKKNEEYCTSKQSGITADSVSPGMIQNVVTANVKEASKAPGENSHACSSSLQGEVNKSFDSQNSHVRETLEHCGRIQQVQDMPNFSRESLDVTESTSAISKPKNIQHKEVESSMTENGYLPGKAIDKMSSDSSKVKSGRIGKQKQNTEDWDSLRLQAQSNGKRRERSTNTMDSLDWEAVRCAHVNEIANTIKDRGMQNNLAERIKDFLNRLVREHGSIDLEWLRDVPPDKAKEYLLSVRGLGLKSVECVRLLTLHHLAFPVDTNVGRIAVRLGWVPLQPLPESLQLHLLELYPVLESIQRYLWPRLCKLDQRALYELHYQMITFGKVFCTKSKPNCNACPMRGECRHFASAFASARLSLPGPEGKSIVSATENKAANQNPVEIIKPLQLPPPQVNQQLQAHSQISTCEPIIEVPATPEPTIEVPTTPEPTVEVPTTPEPIVEVPATPELEQQEVPESDIEDLFCEDPEEIPMIKLNIEEFTQNLQNYMQQNMELQEGDVSKALVALTAEATSIPVPKLKNTSRLRTEHQVYELPDWHPLLEGLDKRDTDDPCSYLLAIWTPGETANSIQPPEMRCDHQECGKLCDDMTCFSCNSIREANSQTVRGTILIPCRTAMRGSFPLNGTYFQVNEVFADHESSINPIDVPRAWIWNLPRRTVYFGTSIPTIFKGLSTESIQYCFWRGFVCVRGFDQKTRAPRPLMARLHFPASKLEKTKGETSTVKQ